MFVCSSANPTLQTMNKRTNEQINKQTQVHGPLSSRIHPLTDLFRQRPMVPSTFSPAATEGSRKLPDLDFPFFQRLRSKSIPEEETAATARGAFEWRKEVCSSRDCCFEDEERR